MAETRCPIEAICEHGANTLIQQYAVIDKLVAALERFAPADSIQCFCLVIPNSPDIAAHSTRCTQAREALKAAQPVAAS